MSILKKKTKVSSQLFTVTFYLAVLGFLFGAFGLGFSLLNFGAMKSRDNSLANGNFQTYQQQQDLKTCYEHNIHPCNKDTINAYMKSLSN